MATQLTSWVLSWQYRCQTNGAAEEKRNMKKSNHRMNRRVTKSELKDWEDGDHTFHISPNGWDVI